MSLKKNKERVAEEEKIRKIIIEWYFRHGRNFPWREKNSLDPYKVLVTEILLQKTRTETVAQIWDDFFKAYPDVGELAKTNERQLLTLIKPLGLTSRAKRLIKVSCQIVNEFNGLVPSSFEDLIRLYGVGPYIGSAVLCFAYGKPTPIVDVNIMRLMNRFRGLTDEKSIREYLSNLIPTNYLKEFNWSLLDIASLICRNVKPLCYNCPIEFSCVKANVQKSNWRIFRKKANGKLSLQPYST